MEYWIRCSLTSFVTDPACCRPACEVCDEAWGNVGKCPRGQQNMGTTMTMAEVVTMPSFVTVPDMSEEKLAEKLGFQCPVHFDFNDRRSIGKRLISDRIDIIAPLEGSEDNLMPDVRLSRLKTMYGRHVRLGPYDLLALVQDYSKISRSWRTPDNWGNPRHVFFDGAWATVGNSSEERVLFLKYPPEAEKPIWGFMPTNLSAHRWCGSAVYLPLLQ